MLTRINNYILDQLLLLPILIINWALWAVSGFHKVHSIINGTAWIAPNGWIPWLTKHFNGTIFEPITEPLFFILTFLQAFTGILLTIAILRFEFIHNRHKGFFKLGLFFGALNIAFMSIAQNITNSNQDVFELTSYMSTTLISYFFLLLYEEKRNLKV